MKNTILKAIAATSLVAIAATSVFADGHKNVSISGTQRFAVSDFDDGVTSTEDKLKFKTNRTDLHIDAKFEDESGLKYGARTDIQAKSGGNKAEEQYIYLSGDFGKVTLGLDDSAFGGVSKGKGVGKAVYDQNTPSTSVNGAGFSNDAAKIKYDSPSFGGFTFSISYSPDNGSSDATTVTAASTTYVYGLVNSAAASTVETRKETSATARVVGSLMSTAAGVDHSIASVTVKSTTAAVMNTAMYEDEIAISAGYSGDFGVASAKIGVAYMTASANNTKGTMDMYKFEDKTAIMYGAQVSVSDFTIGAHAFDNGDSGLTKDEAKKGNASSGYDLGVGYNYGAGQVGLSFADSESKDSDGIKTTQEAWSVSATYKVAEGLSAYIGYADVEDKTGSAAAVSKNELYGELSLGF